MQPAICSGTSVAHLSSASPLTPPLASVSFLVMLMRTGEDVSTLGAPPQATLSAPVGALWLGSLDEKLQQLCQLLKPPNPLNTWHQLTQHSRRFGFVSFWRP
jgi:hypothetical protein